MLNGFMIFGVVWLLAGATCLVLNWRMYSRGAIKSPLFLATLAAGIGLGVLAELFVWQYDTNTKIAGFPFAAAAFQRDAEGAPYLDFVGPLTTPFLTLNAFCWGLVIQILMYVFFRKRKTIS